MRLDASTGTFSQDLLDVCVVEFLARVVLKDDVYFFKSEALSLRVSPEDVDGHQEVEASKEQVETKSDLLHEDRNDKVEDPVEEPVGSGGEGDTHGTDTEREDFGRVDPAHRTPSGGKRCDKEVDAGDHTVALGAGNMHGPFAIIANVPVTGSHDTTDNPQENRHERSTGDHGRTATPLVDEKNGGNGHDNVDDIVDTRSEQSSFLAVTDTGLLEKKDDVEHDDIHTSQLLPDLEADTKEGAVGVLGLEKIGIAVGRDFAVELDDCFDFLNFKLHARVVDIAVAVDISENLSRLIHAALIGQPTRGEREEPHPNAKDHGRNGLDTPGDTEGSGPVAVLDS